MIRNTFFRMPDAPIVQKVYGIFSCSRTIYTLIMCFLCYLQNFDRCVSLKSVLPVATESRNYLNKEQTENAYTM